MLLRFYCEGRFIMGIENDKYCLIYRREYCEEELAEVAREINQACEPLHIYALNGSLGAGKTTLVQHLVQAYGVKDAVASPTYTYVHVYRLNQGPMLYHFDLYRMQDMRDFINAGFVEYLDDPNAMIYIEWPALILGLLGERACLIDIEYGETSDSRVVNVKAPRLLCKKNVDA